MRVRRDDNPLLALRLLDDDAWIAGAVERCANRADRLRRSLVTDYCVVSLSPEHWGCVKKSAIHA
jgi:hypothetical protein